MSNNSYSCIHLSRECNQFQPGGRRLGPQHGDLRHGQRLRGRVRARILCVDSGHQSASVSWWKPVSETHFSCRPRDAVKAIKKRIAGNKNFKEVMLALTVSFVFAAPSPRFDAVGKQWRTLGLDTVCCSSLCSFHYKRKTT